MTVSPPAPLWSNWSGIESCTPERVVSPADESALQTAVADAAGRGSTVRAVGSGHSFTGAALAPRTQVRMDRLARLVDVDTATGQVVVEAGMPMHRLNALLAEHGLALPNLGDIDRQTISGAISTGTHGTGVGLTGLAGQVTSLRLVAGDGSVVACSPDVEPDLFDAARVSVGALGIISQVALQAGPAFDLRAEERPAGLDEVLDDLTGLVDDHDHFEFYWFPHTARVQTKTNDRVSDGETGRPLPGWRRILDDEVLSNGVFEATNRLSTRFPGLVPRINQVAARALTARTYVAASHDVFVSPRRVRFVESEYAVPRSAVPAVLGELRSWVDRHDERVPFPVEVRFAAADDLWLSTAYQRESGYIAIHQYHRMAYGRYFAAFEAIVAEHEGRPHWGKLHSLDATALAARYPRFADFVALRDRCDPSRVFANDYTTRVFGA